jgi:hypothetical protein
LGVAGGGRRAAGRGILHGGQDHYLPDMTPAEAIALAADLIRAACTAAGGYQERRPGRPHQDPVLPGEDGPFTPRRAFRRR